MPDGSTDVPVLIGAGQVTDRPDDPTAGREPLALMETAAHRAACDAGGGPRLLEVVDTLAVVNVLTWDYGDAPRLLADRLGCRPSRTIYTAIGGNSPQALVNHLCDEIVAGRVGLALVVGAEAWHTMSALGRAGRRPGWTPPSSRPAPLWGVARPGMSEAEVRHGIRVPGEAYALIENAVRAARGQSLADQQGELVAFADRFAAIAKANPYAWSRQGKSGAELATAGPGNRMIAFPYPKRLNANIAVNQGAALLLASEATASRLGMAADAWLYPWGGADVHEPWFLQDRPDHHTLPALDRAARLLLEAVGTNVAAIAHRDLYSCFPIAPRLAAATLGIPADDPRPLTVTGGLPWFGGPGSNYVTHAIATLRERLRAEPGSLGLVHAVGWILTEHAVGIYSTARPPRGWQRAGGASLQARVNDLPSPRFETTPEGPATIETYTVVHDRDGVASRGSVFVRLPGGERGVAVLPHDRDLLEAMEREEPIGRSGRVRGNGPQNVFEPT